MGQAAVKLDQRRVALGLTRLQVQERAGIGASQVTQVFRGDWESLQWRTIEKVLTTLGWSQDNLFYEGQLPPAPEPPGVHTKLDRILTLLDVPHASAPVLIEPSGPQLLVGLFGKSAAGFGTTNEPRAEPEEWIEIPAKYKPRNGTLIATRVTGDSMEPELQSGDIVIAEYPDRQPALRLLKDGALVVVTTDEWEDYVKRYHFDSVAKEDTLVSTNAAYGPIPVPGAKRVRFVGIVRMVMKGLD